MRSRKTTLIVYAMFTAAMFVGLYICGKQIMTATESIVEHQNNRYAQIEKALGR